MHIQKLRKIKIVEPKHWKDLTDILGLPTIMFHELIFDVPIVLGDKITLDLRILVEKKESHIE